MTPKDIVGKAIEALLARHDHIKAQLEALPVAAETESRGLNPDEEAALDQLLAEAKSISADLKAHEDRYAELEAIEARAAAAAARPSLTFIKPAEKADVTSIRSMSLTQLTDVVRRKAEERDIDPTHAARLFKRHGADLDWARNLAARSTDVYERAWLKVMTGNANYLTEEERTAVAVGTSTQGGLLVPTHLDPTVILTNTGSANAIRRVSRVVTLTVGNTWNGVSSAGVSASWDAELAEVSDDSPTPFAKPSIPTYKAQAFVQASVEALEDIASLGADVLNMFADARDRLEGAAHCTGSGSAQPTGIFTAITGSQSVTSTTAATIGLVDLLALKRKPGIRWRNNGTFVMNAVYADAIRQLGTALGASFTVDANAANTELLLGRPVIETDDAPTTQTTTAKDPEVIFGDFSNYVLVDKPGSLAVQYVPVLFNTANNLPDGRIGWYAHWRHGADSVADEAFAVLLDKTSA
jgi:HK97 family phage major capsid protein